MLFSVKSSSLLLVGSSVRSQCLDCMASKLLIPFIACWALVDFYYQEFSSSRYLSERISISTNAINVMMRQYTSNNGQFNGTANHYSWTRLLSMLILSGIGFWGAANTWSAIANHDLQAPQHTRIKSLVG